MMQQETYDGHKKDRKGIMIYAIQIGGVFTDRRHCDEKRNGKQKQKRWQTQ